MKFIEDSLLELNSSILHHDDPEKYLPPWRIL